nr:MAG TPA: hypothetical protein [Caudoviricetes sp.]
MKLPEILYLLISIMIRKPCLIKDIKETSKRENGFLIESNILKRMLVALK